MSALRSKEDNLTNKENLAVKSSLYKTKTATSAYLDLPPEATMTVNMHEARSFGDQVILTGKDGHYHLRQVIYTDSKIEAIFHRGYLFSVLDMLEQFCSDLAKNSSFLNQKLSYPDNLKIKELLVTTNVDFDDDLKCFVKETEPSEVFGTLGPKGKRFKLDYDHLLDSQRHLVVSEMTWLVRCSMDVLDPFDVVNQFLDLLVFEVDQGELEEMDDLLIRKFLGRYVPLRLNLAEGVFACDRLINEVNNLFEANNWLTTSHRQELFSRLVRHLVKLRITTLARQFCGSGNAVAICFVRNGVHFKVLLLDIK